MASTVISKSTPIGEATLRRVPRSEHCVTRALISDNALKVLNRLNDAGFTACLVGGGVRDILTGGKPKDFDVATNATPEEVKGLFRNSRIIGRRFRLVHVVYGRDVIEVATFRAGHDSGAGGEIGDQGRILRDNVFGTIEEDAIRRDFTVNALYYDIKDHAVLDFVGGLDDIDLKLFRLIGDPVVRCQEDPVRVIRAARLAAKLNFDIHSDTHAAMDECAPLLRHQPAPRMFEEVLKLFQGGYALRSFERLREHDLLQYLFPVTSARIETQPDSLLPMIEAGLINTDKRVGEGKPITPAYLLAFMLWPQVHEFALQGMEAGKNSFMAIMDAADRSLPPQLKVTSIPKRFSGPMREIWTLQAKLEQFTGPRALALMENRRFRAAYDFLCLRTAIQPELTECADWWTRVQEVEGQEQLDAMLEARVPVDGDWKEQRKKKSRRRRPNKKRKSSIDSSSVADGSSQPAKPIAEASDSPANVKANATPNAQSQARPQAQAQVNKPQANKPQAKSQAKSQARQSGKKRAGKRTGGSATNSSANASADKHADTGSSANAGNKDNIGNKDNTGNNAKAKKPRRGDSGNTADIDDNIGNRAPVDGNTKQPQDDSFGNR